MNHIITIISNIGNHWFVWKMHKNSLGYISSSSWGGRCFCSCIRSQV